MKLGDGVCSEEYLSPAGLHNRDQKNISTEELNCWNSGDTEDQKSRDNPPKTVSVGKNSI